MALGDQSFTAALGRLRTAISLENIKAAKLRTIKEVDHTSIRTRKEVLADLSDVVGSLASIHIGSGRPLTQQPTQTLSSHTPSAASVASVTSVSHPEPPLYEPGSPKKRWHRHKLTRTEIPNLSLTAPSIEEKYLEVALAAARTLAKSSDGGIYDETNDPLSTDWMTVMSWLIDRMFLAGVPAHYLITDPSHLDHESLRFFRIDPNWVDALIDGASSLGNHMGTDMDSVAIKKNLNDYIENVNTKTGHKTQIPTNGFYLRSDLVTMFPDLRVEVLSEQDSPATTGSPPSGAPLLRHEIITDGVMMGLVGRVPGSSDFGRLFTQPPHQQRFAVARELDTTMVKVNIRRQYTVDETIRETDANRWDALKEYIYKPTGDQSADNIFIWDSEPGSGLNDLLILRLPRLAQLQLDTLQELMPTYKDVDLEKLYFDDNTATSALLAMQLNDPIYNLTIDLKGTGATAMLSSGARPESSDSIRTLKQLVPVRGNKPKNIDNECHDDNEEPALFLSPKMM